MAKTPLDTYYKLRTKHLHATNIVIFAEELKLIYTIILLNTTGVQFVFKKTDFGLLYMHGKDNRKVGTVHEKNLTLSFIFNEGQKFVSPIIPTVPLSSQEVARLHLMPQYSYKWKEVLTGDM